MSLDKHSELAAVAELAGLNLGNKAREARAFALLERLATNPGGSIRALARSTAEEEAFYRFIGKDAVSMPALIEPHIAQTVTRCKATARVVVPHDTSNFEYRGSARTGLGRVRTASSQGFLFHAALGIDATTGQPCGLLASKVWTRSEERKSLVEGANGPRRKAGSDYARTANKESDRWFEQIEAVEQRFSKTDCQLVHVADREADIFALLATLQERGYRFVIRLARDKKARQADGDPLESLKTLARRANGLLEVRAPIAARAKTKIPQQAKTFPEREVRTARLEFAAITAEINGPVYNDKASLPINVVHVREVAPPHGVEPIEWYLLTSEPIDTVEQVREVVQAYRMRWLIEEFFKVLKTGCAMEDRELESLHTLTNVLALCIPIAYRLLALRHLARTRPDGSALDVFTETQIAILQAKTKLGPNPTPLQVLEAVAYLGSHFIPFSRKMPGWQVLMRGMQRLAALEEGWSARDAQKVIER